MASERWRRTEGLQVEPVGSSWAVFSPMSGDTLLLNDAAAAVLELLVEGVLSSADIECQLALDMGLPTEPLGAVVEETCETLKNAGLVQSFRD